MPVRIALVLATAIALAFPGLRANPVYADAYLCSQPGVHLISTIGQLESIGSPAMPLDGTYCLTQDIDAHGAAYPPISDVPPLSSAIPFEGTLDGQGHVIRDLRIVGTDMGGLFGVSAGTIQDIGLVRETVTTAGGIAGGLVGFNYGTLNRAFVIGSVAGGSAVYAGEFGIGALVGNNWGNVCDSYSGGSASGGANNYVGGLVGNGSPSNSYSAATATGGPGTYTGGLAGGSGHVDFSYSLGQVSGPGPSWQGGLTGFYGGGSHGSTWDTTTSGLSRGAGTVYESGPLPSGLDDAQMRVERNFLTAGWYFAGGQYISGNHWVMVNGVTYPFLIWQVTIANLAANTYGYATTTALADKLDALLTRAGAAQAAHDTSSMDSLLRSYVKLVSSMSGRSFTPLDDRLLVMEAALILAGDSGLPCCDYPPC